MPDIDNSTNEVYADQFRAGYELALQQRMSKFDPHVTMLPPINGVGGTIVNFVEPFEAETGGDDLGDTKWSIPEFNTRWAFPIKIRSAVPVTMDDQLYTLADPSNPLIEATVAAHRRAMDKKIIIPAMFRDVVGGKDKDKTFTFDTVNDVIGKDVGGANTGFNWYKFVQAETIFAQREVDTEMDPVTIGIDPIQHAHMLHMVETKNEDFRKLGIVVENGRVKKFGHWNIALSNQLEYSADLSVVYNPVWVRSGIGVVTWLNPRIRVDERPDKNYTRQIFAEMRAGAARMQESKVLRIECRNLLPAAA